MPSRHLLQVISDPRRCESGSQKLVGNQYNLSTTSFRRSARKSSTLALLFLPKNRRVNARASAIFSLIACVCCRELFICRYSVSGVYFQQYRAQRNAGTRNAMRRELVWNCVSELRQFTHNSIRISSTVHGIDINAMPRWPVRSTASVKNVFQPAFLALVAIFPVALVISVGLLIIWLLRLGRRGLLWLRRRCR